MFLARRFFVELLSQNRNMVVKREPRRPYRLDASTVRPKSIPSKIRKKIYRMRFKFISKIALGSK